MRRPVSILAALLLAAPFIHAEVAASASGSLARFMDGEIPVPMDWERELEEGGDSMPQSFLFTGAPTSEPIALEAVTSAPTVSSEEEQDPSTTAVSPTRGPTAVPPVDETPAPEAVTAAPTASEEEGEDPSTTAITSSPTAVPPIDVQNETAAPTSVPSAAGSSEEEGDVDAQGQGSDTSAPPPPAGTGGNAGGAPSSGNAGGEVTPEATPEPILETETPAATPEASLEPVVEPVAPAADTPVATPAPSDGTAVPVTTILLELAGSTTQKLQATTVIVAEVERVLKTKANFSSARRELANAFSSTPFFAAAVRRALQDTTTAGALCASSETPKSVITITLSNYDDTVAANALLKEIIGGITPLTLNDGTAVRDTICKEEVSLKMVSTVTPVSPMDDVPKEESGNSSGLGTDAVIAIAVLVPATVLLFIFFAYRRRSNSRVAQV